MEQTIPNLGYRELVHSLPFLSDVGVLQEGSLPAMLVVARLMDRHRVLQSGMKSAELRDALATYQRSTSGRPVASVESAMLDAVSTAQHAEWDRLGAGQ